MGQGIVGSVLDGICADALKWGAAWWATIALVLSTTALVVPFLWCSHTYVNDAITTVLRYSLSTDYEFLRRVARRSEDDSAHHPMRLPQSRLGAVARAAARAKHSMWLCDFGRLVGVAILAGLTYSIFRIVGTPPNVFVFTISAAIVYGLYSIAEAQQTSRDVAESYAEGTTASKKLESVTILNEDEREELTQTAVSERDHGNKRLAILAINLLRVTHVVSRRAVLSIRSTIEMDNRGGLLHHELIDYIVEMLGPAELRLERRWSHRNVPDRDGWIRSRLQAWSRGVRRRLRVPSGAATDHDLVQLFTVGRRDISERLRKKVRSGAQFDSLYRQIYSACEIDPTCDRRTRRRPDRGIDQRGCEFRSPSGSPKVGATMLESGDHGHLFWLSKRAWRIFDSGTESHRPQPAQDGRILCSNGTIVYARIGRRGWRNGHYVALAPKPVIEQLSTRAEKEADW